MSFNEIKETVVQTLREFSKEGFFLHGAALSYYALMALVPVMYLSITYFGYFVGTQTMIDAAVAVLQEQVGIEDVSGIIVFLDSVDLESGTLVMEVMGIIVLLFSSTALINSLKKSINEFYDLDTSMLGRKKKIVRGLLFRLISMLFIVGVTVLVLGLYFAETIFLSLGHRFFEDMELLNWFFSGFARHGIPIIMNILIFSITFKYVNDGVVTWKTARIGGIVTGILLYIGQLLIKFYLMNYFFAASSGVSGTLLIILVWVFYSALILFFGAKFTAVYAKRSGAPIQLRD